MKRLRVRARAARTATCFCDACARVTHCDPSHRIAEVRAAAQVRALLH